VKLLLGFVLLMVVLGFVTDRLDWRVYGVVTGAAIMVAGLFFTFERFWS
jgi:hypothetical protein